LHATTGAAIGVDGHIAPQITKKTKRLTTLYYSPAGWGWQGSKR
jgi:hypothetical protein